VFGYEIKKLKLIGYLKGNAAKDEAVQGNAHSPNIDLFSNRKFDIIIPAYELFR
jgi:hypothetical protein